jgi:hypothetical protein
MEKFDWKSEIYIWTQRRRAAKKFDQELIEFFTNAFNYHLRPDKALFGTNDFSISLLVGNIYFAAYGKSGSLWLLLDSKIDTVPNTGIRVVKSSKKFEEPLYWLETTDLTAIASINKNAAIWQSYKRATDKIFQNKSITAYKPKIAFGKVLLNSFWNNGLTVENSLTIKDLDIALEKQIAFYKTLDKKERSGKLKLWDPKPEKVIVIQYAFRRNPLVVLEVLERAAGICEKCKKTAPFLKDNNGNPYLEVHHIIPLAENGDDTVENAIALCANCHRHAHHGKSTY